MRRFELQYTLLSLRKHVTLRLCTQSRTRLPANIPRDLIPMLPGNREQPAVDPPPLQLRHARHLARDIQ